MNESTELSWGFESMSLKCSYEFRIMNPSIEQRRVHWKMFYKTVWKQCQQNHVEREKARSGAHNLVIQLLL